VKAESLQEFGQQWVQVCDAFNRILNCRESTVVLRQEQGDEPASIT
jgi:hypothetical protein